MFLEDGVGVFEGIGLVIALEVGAHHSGAGHAGTDDTTSGDQVNVVFTAEFT